MRVEEGFFDRGGGSGLSARIVLRPGNGKDRDTGSTHQEILTISRFESPKIRFRKNRILTPSLPLPGLRTISAVGKSPPPRSKKPSGNESAPWGKSKPLVDVEVVGQEVGDDGCWDEEIGGAHEAGGDGVLVENDD